MVVVAFLATERCGSGSREQKNHLLSLLYPFWKVRDVYLLFFFLSGCSCWGYNYHLTELSLVRLLNLQCITWGNLKCHPNDCEAVLCDIWNWEGWRCMADFFSFPLEKKQKSIYKKQIFSCTVRTHLALIWAAGQTAATSWDL